jgi:hypothetical protein
MEMMIRKLIIVAIAVFLQMHFGASYLLGQTEKITRQETLRGSVTPEREWWDLLHYDLNVEFFIVHESAHEWFGNNISMKDAADIWIHEGFANYSENLFVEYHFGKKARKANDKDSLTEIQRQRKDPVI